MKQKRKTNGRERILKNKEATTSTNVRQQRYNELIKK